MTEFLGIIATVAVVLTAKSFVPKALASQDDALPGQKEADELLAMCDTAAEMWEGEFNAAEDIRQMRRERDEQIRRN